jgi:UDP-glucose 4-epimerase
MSGCVIWIIGRGGLLGSRLLPALAGKLPQSTTWEPSTGPFSWDDPARLAAQLEAAVFEFAAAVRMGNHAWVVLWAAGAGVIGTTEQTLAQETKTLSLLLDLVGQHLGGSSGLPGLLLVSSSAGGVYGECPDRPITENSLGRPISPYGRNKVRQEEWIQSWSQAHPRINYLIARISNLYGPGQNMAKPQGLISQIARSLILQRPIQIYVPLDTIRDYLYADDCAVQIVACLLDWLNNGAIAGQGQQGRIKIFASEQTTSIAQVIAAFSRLAPRYHPRVICATSRLGAQQPRTLQFHSIVPPDLHGVPRTTLQVGINQVYRYQLELYRRAQLRA